MWRLNYSFSKIVDRGRSKFGSQRPTLLVYPKVKQRQRRNTRDPRRWHRLLSVLVTNKRGFTLIELLVTIAIAAILAMVAVPSFNEAIVNYRLTSYTNNFLASAQLARSEAIKRNSRMTLCKSANGTSCTSAGGWHQGWIIFNDSNNDALKDSGEVVVYKESAMPADFLMTGSANVDNYMSFVPSGATELVSRGLQTGTWTLCSQSGSSGQARQLIINSAGRLRVTKNPIAPCV